MKSRKWWKILGGLGAFTVTACGTAVATISCTNTGSNLNYANQIAAENNLIGVQKGQEVIFADFRLNNNGGFSSKEQIQINQFVLNAMVENYQNGGNKNFKNDISWIGGFQNLGINSETARYIPNKNEITGIHTEIFGVLSTQTITITGVTIGPSN